MAASSRATLAIRQEPFRLFFPLGLLLAVTGVGHWLLFALELTTAYRSIFHSMVQVQGFLICFALGFLFTMLPRRTATAPAAGWEIGLGLLCPVGTTLFAWREQWVAAQAFWLLLLILLGRFLAQRLGPKAGRRPPSSFVWLPVAILFGFGGALLTGAVSGLMPSNWVLHELGRGLVLQGTFLALVLGVSGLALPLMTRNDPPPDSGPSPEHRRERRLHLLAALLLLASFLLEAYVSLRLGLMVRGLVVLTVLVAGSGLLRTPSRPGANRHLIWIAAWCLPLGYFVAAADLSLYKGGLHVTFIGGFALLVLTVSTQVVLGHGGYEELRDGRPLALLLMAAALLVSVSGRLMMEVQEQRLTHWMLVAAASFLVAAVCWFTLLVPRLWPRRTT